MHLRSRNSIWETETGIMKKMSCLETQLWLVKPFWNIISISKEITHNPNCHPNQLLSLVQDELYLLNVCQKRFMSSYIPCGIKDVCTKTTDIINDLLSNLSLLEQQLVDSWDALGERKWQELAFKPKNPTQTVSLFDYEFPALSWAMSLLRPGSSSAWQLSF